MSLTSTTRATHSLSSYPLLSFHSGAGILSFSAGKLLVWRTFIQRKICLWNTRKLYELSIWLIVCLLWVWCIASCGTVEEMDMKMPLKNQGQAPSHWDRTSVLQRISLSLSVSHTDSNWGGVRYEMAGKTSAASLILSGCVSVAKHLEASVGQLNHKAAGHSLQTDSNDGSPSTKVPKS